jgi:hypothetical protein
MLGPDGTERGGSAEKGTKKEREKQRRGHPSSLLSSP